MLAKCGGVKNGKGQKAKEEAKETVLGFLKLDTSASNRSTERPQIALFLGLENGHLIEPKGSTRLFRVRSREKLALHAFVLSCGQ